MTITTRDSKVYEVKPGSLVFSKSVFHFVDSTDTPQRVPMSNVSLVGTVAR